MDGENFNIKILIFTTNLFKIILNFSLERNFNNNKSAILNESKQSTHNYKQTHEKHAHTHTEQTRTIANIRIHKSALKHSAEEISRDRRFAECESEKIFKEVKETKTHILTLIQSP